MSVRILLADDHTLMRQGLRRILESHADFDIVNESSSGIEAVEAARQLKRDVAIVDVGMKELNGIEATAQILKYSPHTAVLILSMYDDERYVLRAVKAGARGYVLKNSAGEELIQAIHAVQQGMAFFSPAVARVFQDGGPGCRIPVISPTASNPSLTANARSINSWRKATATKMSPTVST
jgi:DNA-binding NarL/FixJ family response regulator